MNADDLNAPSAAERGIQPSPDIALPAHTDAVATPESASLNVEPSVQAPVAAEASRASSQNWIASPEAERAAQLERAARLALKLAGLALHPPRRADGPAAPELACDLYRQAIFCALRALELVPSSDSAATSSDSAPTLSTDFDDVWARAPRAVLVSAAGGEQRVDALAKRLAGATFIDLARLDVSEASALAADLAPLAHGLLRSVEARQWAQERKGVVRWLRIFALALLALLVAVGLSVGPDALEARRDLAKGKPWRASSTFAGGCDSPEQECAGNNTYFVHTQEEDNPWVEFDLGRAQSVSGARILNRTDCCAERIVPLIVEVSLDQKHWKEVDRTTRQFYEYKSSFARTMARWVRLRVQKRTNLHLRRVIILP